MEGACPVNGFTYGEHGDFHSLSLPVHEEEAVEEEDEAPAAEDESLE